MYKPPVSLQEKYRENVRVNFMPLEQEIKFIEVDFHALRAALQEAGFDFQSRYFERNAVLDDAEGSLRAGGNLLRLRSADTCTLTVKLAVGSGESENLKQMDERETEVGNFEAMLSILEGLGFQPSFWYEKIRESWRLGRVEVDLDVLPFGEFVEIEGPQEEIEVAVGRLGLKGHASTVENYHELNLAYRKEHGLPLESGFVFEPGEVERILALGRFS
jgi:adenylate cyclase class 2